MRRNYARVVRQRLRAMPWDVALFSRRIRRRIPVSEVQSGPLVSVVLIEPRREAIAGQLAALERTTYRPIELLLIADPDDEVVHRVETSTIAHTWVTAAPGGDRAPAINEAIEAATGEFICLIDGAVQPVHDDWLGHLVERVTAGAVAAAPILIRPAGRGLVRARQKTADLTVLSGGIELERSAGIITPRHVAVGERFGWEPAEPYRDVAAVSLACVVVRRADLVAAGGVPSGYAGAGTYSSSIPYADVDLSSSLQADGRRLTLDRRVLAWCRYDDPTESAAEKPSKDPRAAWDTTSERARLIDRWGPRLIRQLLLDAVAGAHAWSAAPMRVARIGAGSSPRLTGVAGWEIVDVPAGGPWSGKAAVRADAVVVSDPDLDIDDVPTGLIRIAWVASTTPRKLDSYDIVVAATDVDRDRIAGTTAKQVVVADLDDDNEALPRLLRDWLTARRIGVRIGPTKWRNAHLWGDYHFARALQRYLERAGHPTRVRILGDWASPAAAMDDATLHLFGNQVAYNRPSQVNVLWQISHPDMASGGLYDTYDHAFVASDVFAARMAGQARVPVAALHQATDPERFYPDPIGPRHELLFVANYRPERPIVAWLVPTDRDLAIYGRAWEEHGLDPRYLRGSHIPNAELRCAYSSAGIVLNDTWEDMRAAGFISNRIYDALACGAFVLSDDVDGLVEEFDDGVAIYRDQAGLRTAVEIYLTNPELRRAVAERGRTAVLARHTFEQRAAAILAVLRPLLDARPARVIGVPKS